MALPGVGQAAMLASELRRALERTRAKSLAVVGCAGGNGLNEVSTFGLERVVCVDVNPRYIDALQRRYAEEIEGLECHCGELERLRGAAPVDLVFAGLIFEYTRLDEALDSSSRLLTPGGHLIALVQMPAPGVAKVTASPFAQALEPVGELFHFVSPSILAEMASRHALRETDRRVFTLAAGKSFTVVEFRKGPC